MTVFGPSGSDATKSRDWRISFFEALSDPPQISDVMMPDVVIRMRRRCSRRAFLRSRVEAPSLILLPELIRYLPYFAVVVDFAEPLWRITSAEFDHLDGAAILIVDFGVGQLLSTSKRS